MKWDKPGLCTIGTPHEGFSVAVHTDFEWPSADGFNLILSLIGFYKPLSQTLPRTATVDTANRDMARKWTQISSGGKEKTTILIFAPKNETKLAIKRPKVRS